MFLINFILLWFKPICTHSLFVLHELNSIQRYLSLHIVQRDLDKAQLYLSSVIRMVLHTVVALKTVPMYYSGGTHAKKNPFILSKRQNCLLCLCPCLSVSGLQSSRKAQKAVNSHQTGRDRAACIPAFLQIRPGKADYSDPFLSSIPLWVEVEGGYF